MGRARLQHSLHQRKVIYAATVALWHPGAIVQAQHLTSSKDVWEVKLSCYLQVGSISYYACGPVPEVVNGPPEAQPLAGGLTQKG